MSTNIIGMTWAKNWRNALVDKWPDTPYGFGEAFVYDGLDYNNIYSNLGIYELWKISSYATGAWT